MSTETNKFPRFHPVMALFALAPLALVPPAQASGSEARTTTVSIADLDLSTSEGANVARERLHQTARQLCAQTLGKDSANPRKFIACLNDTVSDALRQIDVPGRAAIESGAWTILPSQATSGLAAAAGVQTKLMVVLMADVDLSTPEGARIASERIRKSARHVCGQLTAEETTLTSHYSNCVDEATAAGLRQISAAQVAAMQDAPKAHIEITTRVASK
jgi:UrcA family protein